MVAGRLVEGVPPVLGAGVDLAEVRHVVREVEVLGAVLLDPLDVPQIHRVVLLKGKVVVNLQTFCMSVIGKLRVNYSKQ